MAILLSAKITSWMTNEALRDLIAPMLPGVAIACQGEAYDPAAIQMLAVDRLAPGEAAGLPNLRLVQKLGAGVETIVRSPDLPPGVRVARLKPKDAAKEMADFAVASVMREQVHLRFYAAEQAAGRWSPRPPRPAASTVVGVLGLGHVGGGVARAFVALGFQVLGASRSAREIEGVECLSGDAGFEEVLARADHLISVLPSTDATRGLMNARAFAAMKPGSMFVNIGRGDLVVEEDLLAALDTGRPDHAVLDVVSEEPLPAGHPFWNHPAVTITPHVSGWELGDAIDDVAENYLRLQDGRPLLNAVDRTAGY